MTEISQSRVHGRSFEQLEEAESHTHADDLLRRAGTDAGLNTQSRETGKTLSLQSSDPSWATLKASRHNRLGPEEATSLVSLGNDIILKATLPWASAAKIAIQGYVSSVVLGAKLQDANQREAIRGGMLHALELPAHFRAEELKKLQSPTQDGRTRVYAKLTDGSAAHTQIRNTLQMYCDHGIVAAMEMHQKGGSKDVYLASHPSLAKQYENNLAFREGFDAACWAKERGPAEVKALDEAVKSRDARFQGQTDVRA